MYVKIVCIRTCGYTLNFYLDHFLIDLTRPYVILPQLLHVEEISLWKEFLGQESVRTSGLNKLNRHCRTSQKL